MISVVIQKCYKTTDYIKIQIKANACLRVTDCF